MHIFDSPLGLIPFPINRATTQPILAMKPKETETSSAKNQAAVFKV
jgi:hypothetical protein